MQERLKEAEKTRFDRCHEEALQIIMEAAQRNWVAAGWWLERNLAHLYLQRPFMRPSSDNQPTEEETPAEALARHRALLLELAREDEARADSRRTGGLMFGWSASVSVAQTIDREQEKAILNFPREFVARIGCSEKLKLFIATAGISANKNTIRSCERWV